MKNVIYLLFSCMFFAVCNCCSKDSSQEEWDFREFREFKEFPRPTDTYDYPILPGSDEWAQFMTGREMKEACQIPTEIVSKMSTQALIQSLWEHPFSPDPFFLRGEFVSDLELCFFNNNAFVELTKRQDAGEALFERLSVCYPVTDYLPDSLITTEYIHKLIEAHFMELLMLQTVFLSQLNDNTKVNLVKIALLNDSLKQNGAGRYRPVSWVLIGRTMVSAGYGPFIIKAVKSNEQMQYFLDGWKPYSYNGMEMRIGYYYDEFGDNAIQQDIINFGISYINNQ